MNYPIRHSLILASVLFLGEFAVGCTTVVTPLSTSNPISTDGSHGLVIGNIQLVWHGTDRSEGLKQPLGLKWSIEEETQGTHFVLADLPTAGPFVVKLPAGSYRVKGIRFDGLWGTWHTVLPTTFQVHSGGCTSLGTWELLRETESFPEWITGQVFKDLEPTPGELQQIIDMSNCPTLTAQLESSVRSKLAFQNRLGGFEF